MWRGPLSIATLAATTHRKPEEVSNGTDTQVRAQMIDKCRVKIVQRKLYNVIDPAWKRGGRKREKEHCSNKDCTHNRFNWFISQLTSSDNDLIQLNTSCACLITFQLHTSRCQLPLTPLYTLCLGSKNVYLQLALSVGRTCAIVSTTVKHGRIRTSTTRACGVPTTGQLP